LEPNPNCVTSCVIASATPRAPAKPPSVTMIGEKSRLLQILNECVGQDASSKEAVRVFIGSEIPTPSFQNCTLISAPYRIGDQGAIGTLNVLGPTRIEYARLISVVSYLARVLEKIMTNDVRNN